MSCGVDFVVMRVRLLLGWLHPALACFCLANAHPEGRAGDSSIWIFANHVANADLILVSVLAHP